MPELDLVLCHGTVAGANFRDRLEAAVAGGYGGIGLAIAEYRRLLQQGWTDQRLLDELARHDLRVFETEVIFGFDVDPGPANLTARPGLVYADPDVERTVLHLADVFGVRTVLAVGAFADPPPDPLAAQRFGALCDRAAEHGLRVALEFVPYSDIRDVSTASRVVAEADRANGGLCVDSWHFFRGGSSLVDLAAVDGASVFLVQINDGPATPEDLDLMTDAVHNRRVPGTGDFDLPGFLATLWAAGVRTPISVEIYSDALNELTPTLAAGQAAAGTRDAIAAALARQAHRSDPREDPTI